MPCGGGCNNTGARPRTSLPAVSTPYPTARTPQRSNLEPSYYNMSQDNSSVLSSRYYDDTTYRNSSVASSSSRHSNGYETLSATRVPYQNASASRSPRITNTTGVSLFANSTMITASPYREERSVLPRSPRILASSPNFNTTTSRFEPYLSSTILNADSDYTEDRQTTREVAGCGCRCRRARP